MLTKSRLFCLVISVLSLSACGTDQGARTNSYAGSETNALEKKIALLEKALAIAEQEHQAQVTQLRGAMSQKAQELANAERKVSELNVLLQQKDADFSDYKGAWQTLNCPIMWGIRQTCAGVGNDENYQRCMARRFGKGYTPNRDLECQQR
jgi:hypothetical protein